MVNIRQTDNYQETSPHKEHTLVTLSSQKGTCLWLCCEQGVKKV